MRLSLAAVVLLLGLSSLLGLAGCGGPPSRDVPEQQPAVEKEPDTEPAASHEILGSTIRIVDPEGRWVFRAEADRIEAESIDGPYALESARAVYEEAGKAPVSMTANQARVDLASRRAVFEGEVTIASEDWRVEGVDRAEYDLDTGQVVATGRTK
jgi:lipopolysaccharide assembly outer membrane protein LptD (OstA)